ncbi:MAG: 6-pyruvoyl-tetrahydropterin synthase-related protein [Patescibacteria group bacterium]
MFIKKTPTLRIKGPILWLLMGSVLILYFTAPSLNPFKSGMFGFQDPTQVGRVTSFVGNLKSGHIPPRLAPEYSFHLGFPVFNFYAPTAYWLTSLIALTGISSITAVKLSFLFSMLGAYFGMYFLLSKLFASKRALAPLLGASVYVTSTYFATEIVVRGNLAECWFLALLPICLGLIIHNSQSQKRSIQIATTFLLALLFTSHNMMMLFAVPTAVIFLLFFPNKRKNILALGVALLIDSYFLIPAFLEGSLVQATHVAKEYIYSTHFLCAWQLWTAKGWVFGGSVPGCEDPTEMSFKIGKLQFILGTLGLSAFLFKIFRQKKISQNNLPLLFIAVFSVGAFFLTLYPSQFIWDFFSSVMALFQFPWRFIVFGLFGIAVFAGYLFHAFHFPLQKIIAFTIVLFLFISGRKYFITPTMPFDTYQTQYNSDEYFSQHLAYKMPEYLVTIADLPYWRSLQSSDEKKVDLSFDPALPTQSTTEYTLIQNTPFEKSLSFMEAGDAIINIHYFPFWKIMVNDQQVFPTHFDMLARPIMSLDAGDKVTIQYEQTSIEKAADILSLIGFILLFSTPLFLPKIDTRV